jgi:hypothetical protein
MAIIKQSGESMKFLNHTVILGAALLTGCATLPDVNIDAAKFNGGGKNLATTQHAKARYFYFFTKADQTAQATASAIASMPIIGVLGAGIAGGTAGAVAQAANESRFGFTSEQFSKTNGIVDPKITIEKILAVELAKQYNLTNQGSARTAIESGSRLEELVSKNSEYPYVLDVSTKRWMLHEGQTDKFSLKYSVNMALIDTEKKTSIAQGSCLYESPADIIEFEKLKANNLSQFNGAMASAVDSCVKQFSEKNLALKIAPH